MPLSFCTLTGVDDLTNLDRLTNLSTRFPFVEWGLLFSPRQQGTGRYPSLSFLKHTLLTLPDSLAVALHVCGGGVNDLTLNEPVVSELVRLIGERSGRVQLNFNITHGKVDQTRLEACLKRLHEIEFIVQYNQANVDVWPMLSRFQNCSALFDASGGRGILKDGWPTTISGIRCGYAGGLGSDTLEAQLPLIREAAAGTNYWIDMESSLRNSNDGFCLIKSEACLIAVDQFMAVAA